MATRETTVFLRNARPNGVIVVYEGTHHKLRHRGHREDSVALPADALNDAQISRWVQSGILEKISKESYMKLGQRTVDVAPNQYLKRPVREGRGIEVPMHKAEADTTNTQSVIVDKDVNRAVKTSLSPQWAGDLMSTEEELESAEYINAQTEPNYPSRHRDDDKTREMGY